MKAREKERRKKGSGRQERRLVERKREGRKKGGYKETRRDDRKKTKEGDRNKKKAQTKKMLTDIYALSQLERSN
jgi:hypothetical protein